MGNSLSVTMNVAQFTAALEGFAGKSSAAVRPAAQAGSQVLYEEVKLRAPMSSKAHFFYGTSYKKTGQRYLFKPGTLKAAIYQAYSEDNSAEGLVATYHVAWNHQKAPYGFMVELGTSNAPAHPFLRPAFDATQEQIKRAIRDRYVTEMRGAPGVKS